jgi:adenylate cyclase
MKRILIILLTINWSLLTIHCSAQKQGQARIDSLLTELPRQKEDTNQVKLLNELSNGYSQINPSEGIKYGQLGLKLATKLNWKKGIGRSYNSLGNSYNNKSEYPKALEYYFKALKVREEIGDKKGIASVMGNIGNIYGVQSDNPKALEYYFKALKLDEEGGYKDYEATVTCCIGNIYGNQGDYPKTLEYYFKSLKLVEELGNTAGIAIMTGAIGNVYLDQKKYILAIEYGQRAIKLCEQLGDKRNIAHNLFNISCAYILIVKDTTGNGGIVTNATELPEYKSTQTASIPKGKAALLAGAIDFIQRSLILCKETQYLSLTKDCYSNLSEAYKLRGDYKKALEALNNFHAIKDSVFSEENKESLIKIGMKNDYDRQRLADSLKVAEKEKIAAINLQKQKSYTYLGIGGVLLLAGFSFFIMKERRKSETARKQSDGLLLNILPTEVANELKSTGTTTAKHYDNVTVLFTDFVNFTQAAEQMNAQGLIDELHACFKEFDEITGKYNIEKIKTIGDAYLAVCGLPTDDAKHAENIVKAAKEITMFMEDRLGKMGVERTFQVRIGIHSGSVVAGIVGVKKFAYDIWGDTVNTAARMEQNSEAGRINISETTYDLVKDKFACEYRGELEAKGKGVMKMYFVS